MLVAYTRYSLFFNPRFTKLTVFGLISQVFTGMNSSLHCGTADNNLHHPYRSKKTHYWSCTVCILSHYGIFTAGSPCCHRPYHTWGSKLFSTIPLLPFWQSARPVSPASAGSRWNLPENHHMLASVHGCYNYFFGVVSFAAWDSSCYHLQSFYCIWGFI